MADISPRPGKPGPSGPRMQEPILDFEFAALSDPGRQRDHNEDFLGHVEPATWRKRGRTVGCLPWPTAWAGKSRAKSRPGRDRKSACRFSSAPAGEPHQSLLMRLVQEANQSHLRNSAGRPVPGGTVHGDDDGRLRAPLRSRRGRACGRFALLSDPAAPSRRSHAITRLRRIRRGSALLSAKEAAEAPTRHVLSRSLGTDLFVSVETSEHQIFPGDVLLLCCDGLYHSVDASDMAAVAGHGGDLNAAAQRLVDLANERDGSDNISVQLIRVRSVERVGMYRGRPYKLR